MSAIEAKKKPVRPRHTKYDALVAHHEAGHAVLAIVFGRRVQRVTIEPGEGHEGFSKSTLGFGHAVGWDTSPRMRRRVEEQIRILLAGGIAQRRMAPRSSKWAESDDRHRAVDLVLRLASPGREAGTYMKLLRIQTEQAVEREWPTICAVAEALIARRTLTGDDVKELRYRAMDGHHQQEG